ncbi:MAG TPA: hypothetical protein VKT78_10885 [Fimbriimonadaceae bacterium]|nr:hypothetical protein [Fimbriimonadaceae bacterium]
MTIGNPKHALILALFALGAIAFFIIRLIPAAAPPGGLQASASTQREVAQAAPPALPTEVLRDAFSHPRLTERYLESLPPEQRTGTGSDTLDLVPLGSLKGAFARLPEAPASGAKPSDIAGSARQHEGRPKSKIVLKAIMRAGKPLALVSLNDKDDVTVGLGEYIDTEHRVTQFSQNAIQLSSDLGKEWLYVGHEVIEK